MNVLGKRTLAAVVALSLGATSPWFTHEAFASGTIADAARADDLAISQQLIEAGADINMAEPDGTTALLWAVYNNSPQLVQVLLDAGADPDAANDLGITPLLQASRYGNADVIRALLSSGARLSVPEPNTEPPLMAAARSGNPAAVDMLLEAGADPNATEPLDQQTALMWAVAKGHQAVVKTLLEAGADPNLQARVSTLTERKNADFPSGGFAALHWAARNGDDATIAMLLDYGADIDVKNGDASTPMMLAIVNDRFDVAADLLERGADANDGSLYFITEMRDATTDWRARDGTVFRADHPNTLSALDLTRLLLEAGADPNQPFVGQMHNTSMCCDSKAYTTPFYRAAVAADVEGMKLMLAHDADTNWSPAEEPKKEADLSTPNGNSGKTPLMMAINGGKGVGVSGGPNDLRQGAPEFRETANRNPLDAVKLLLDAGADVNVQDPNLETALHVAAKALHPDIVRALVAKGADLEVRNKDGLTPLQVVEKMEAPKPTPGFYFQPPPAQPAEIIALLRQLAGDHME